MFRSPLSYLIFICLFTCHLSSSELSLFDLELNKHSISNWNFDNQSIVSGDQRFDLKTLWKIEQNTSVADWSVFTTGVLLHDGSWIPMSALVGGKRDDSIQIASPFGNLEIPLEYVAAWGEYELLQQSEEYDFLLLQNNNKPYGELFGLSNNQLLLQTELSEDPLQIPVEDIRAIRLREQVHSQIGLYLEVITHPQRPPLKILPGKQPALSISKDILLKDWSHCIQMHVIGGNRSFLSDLKPTTVDEKGMFGKVWPHSINSNIDGTPLVLNGQRYHRGLVLHSYAKLEWKTDGKYKRFRCSLGISDQLGSEGNCIVRILGDGKLLWSHKSIRGGHKARHVDIDMANIKTLTLEVDYGERFDIGDHVVFANPYLLH